MKPLPEWPSADCHRSRLSWHVRGLHLIMQQMAESLGMLSPVIRPLLRKLTAWILSRVSHRTVHAYLWPTISNKFGSPREEIRESPRVSGSLLCVCLPMPLIHLA